MSHGSDFPPLPTTAGHGMPQAGLTHDGYIDTRQPRVPPKGPSGISPDPPSLDPIRAHALLCAATWQAVEPDGDINVIVDAARIFEAYLRGGYADASAVVSAVEDVVHEKLPDVGNYDAERIARELAARGLLVRVMPS